MTLGYFGGLIDERLSVSHAKSRIPKVGKTESQELEDAKSVRLEVVKTAMLYYFFATAILRLICYQGNLWPSCWIYSLKVIVYLLYIKITTSANMRFER